MTWFRYLLILVASMDLVGIATADSVFHVQPFNQAAFARTLADIRALRSGGDARPATITLAPGTCRLAETIRIGSEVIGDGLRIEGDERSSTFSGAVVLKEVERVNGAARFRLPAGWHLLGRPRTLLIDGMLSTAARFPRAGYLRIQQSLDDRRSGFIANEGDIPKSFDLSHGPADLLFFHDWSTSRLPIATWNAETRTLKTLGPIGCEASHYAIDHFEKQPRYYLEGHPSFATASGDWFVDEAVGHVVVRVQKNEPTPTIELPMHEQLLVIAGDDSGPVKNVVLKNVTFTGSRFTMPPGGYAGAQATMHEPRDADGNRTTSNRPVVPAAVHIEHATDAKVINCRFEQLGATGLWLGGRTTRCEITNCSIDSVGGNGINLGEDRSRRINGRPWTDAAPEQVPTANTVSNCQVVRPGQLLFGAVGIWASFHAELTIDSCVIADCPYTGISLGWQWNDSTTPARANTISNNTISRVMQKLSDGGGIYTLGRQPDSKLIENDINNVPLNAGRAESNGMFLDQGSTGFMIEGNRFWDIDRSPLRFHQAGNNIAKNNRWTPATSETPFVRFNNTPEENITLTGNTKAEPPAE